MKTISYEFSEKADTTFTSESVFFIKPTSSELVLIFRVLSGTCQITNLNSDDTTSLSANFFFSDFRENSLSDLSFLDGFDEGISLQDYEKRVTDNGVKNRKFYKSFLSELASCVYHEKSSRHTAAYVHLYRAYEHLSYAFPMIYASRTEDYVGTFENLRKWMSGSSQDGNIGELRFHKNFIATLFKGSPELQTTVDIHITTKQEYKETIFKALAEKVAGWHAAENYSPATQKPDKLAIPFLEFHSFLVTLRNRFFHYSNARNDNIGLDDIVEADLLFSFVNKAALNYIATIFHGIIKHQMQH